MYSVTWFNLISDIHVQIFSDKLYTTSGPVSISSPRFVSPLAETILKAAEYLGHSTENTNFDNHLGIIPL